MATAGIGSDDERDEETRNETEIGPQLPGNARKTKGKIGQQRINVISRCESRREVERNGESRSLMAKERGES
jgi:hypothetical protein